MRTDEQLDSSFRASEAWSFEMGDVDLIETSSATGLLGTAGKPQRLLNSISGNERNHLFLSSGAQRFDDLSIVSGLDAISDSRSFVLWDYDRDGWQDIALVNANAPLLNLFHNDIGGLAEPGVPPGNMLAIRFEGGNRSAQPTTDFSSRDGYGALVSVQLGETTLIREQRAGEGFAAQNSATMIVGVGAHELVDSVSVTWPSGLRQQLRGVAEGTLLTIFENPADSPTGEAFVSEPYRREIGRDLFTSRVPGDTVAAISSLPRGQARGQANGRAPFNLYMTMATWCAVCTGELPQIARLGEAFGDKLALFGLPVDPEDAVDELIEYRRRHDPAYRLLTALTSDERAAIREALTDSLTVDGVPSTIITDGEGRVLQMSLGVPTVSEVRRLLAGSSSSG